MSTLINIDIITEDTATAVTDRYTRHAITASWRRQPKYYWSKFSGRCDGDYKMAGTKLGGTIKTGNKQAEYKMKIKAKWRDWEFDKNKQKIVNLSGHKWGAKMNRWNTTETKTSRRRFAKMTTENDLQKKQINNIVYV